MAKFEYTDEMIEKMESATAAGVTEDVITALCEDFGFPRRSVTAKLRKLGVDVPHKPKEAPKFSEEETAALRAFLEAHAGEFTAEEIAEQVGDGKFNARQINGKALSLELTGAIKPADKKVAPKKYTEEQEAQVAEMVEAGAFIEEIAEALGKTVPEVRGKLLSMKLSAPQRDKKAKAADAYDGIEAAAPNSTVAELAAQYGKTERGVKTVLSRRGLAAKDYTPKARSED
jgi:predicted transcriptional regulator